MKGIQQGGFLKTLVTNPNVRVGDCTCYDDPKGVEQFESKSVLYHFPFIGDAGDFGAFA